MLAALVAPMVAQRVQQAPVQHETPTLQLTVRRVLLDVVVTNAQGLPVSGLSVADFKVFEDGRAQKIVAFDANGFSPGMDYVPPQLPAEPPNTFIDLPKEPEKGPLYVLLLDLVNIDSPDQMNSPMDYSTQLFARRELAHFIESKPEGTRFAVFVRSDGLHLVQGFTSDKEVLERVLDPHHPQPHLPAVFLSGDNFGRGDMVSALRTLHSIATYLEGLEGRKNLIWYSSEFPLSLFTDESDDPQYREETKETLDLLAREQIAVYPVDARGVPYGDSHTQLATSVHSDTITSAAESGSGASASTGATGPVGNSPSTTSSFVQGGSTVMGGYNTMDGIARATGGKAFYGDNNVATELVKATKSGGMYYTLAYAPSDRHQDGTLRNIRVELTKKRGYELSYRRFYYGLERREAAAPAIAESGSEKQTGAQMPAGEPRTAGDSLSANMEHGAPEMHQLVFVVQAREEGAAAMGTSEEMAALGTEPAFFRTQKRSKEAKLLAPMLLQKDVFDFEIPKRQFEGEAELHLELAAAAYDADGHLMNAFVRVANTELQNRAGAPEAALFFRIEQGLEVPEGAKTLRFAVRDETNDRVGAMEIKLPLEQVSAGR